MRIERQFSWLISRGEPEHVLEWARLRQALWPGNPLSNHADEVMAMLSRTSDTELAFVAEVTSGALAGFAEASLRHDYVNGCSSSPVLFLEGVYVEPRFRRQGIGGALIKAVRARGKAMGCTEFASDASINNLQSHSFHKALGFEETERVVFFHQLL
jgi:aminoglycoside 6'-N-acetyltransferase I